MNENYKRLKGGYLYISSPTWQQLNNSNYNNATIIEDKSYYINNSVNLVPPTDMIKVDTIVKQPSSINKKIQNKFINFVADSKQIKYDIYKDANNPFYKPLLSSTDDNIMENIFENLETKSNLENLPDEQQALLMEKLKNFEVILPQDIFLPVNNSIAINSLIVDVEDEINEGMRMKKYINKMLGPVFNDIIMKIHRGYLYIVRKGGIINDVITKKLVPSLKYFSWQEGKPINYNILKHIIFNSEEPYNKFFKKIEAEAIIRCEYIIGIQCKSEYQLWCVKRLLMIWYSDPDLFNIIRKIKLLINHYRADAKQEYNTTNGILPMIVIYPRYGINNARILLSKLEYYFSLYMEDTYQKNYPNIYMTSSKPTYFLKKNNLLYYTNGSINLNRFIEQHEQDDKSNSNYDDNPSNILVPSNF